MRRRGLTEADRDAWAGYARTVRALPGGPAAPPEPSTPTAPTALAALVDAVLQEPPAAPAPRLRARPVPVQIGAHPGGIDGGTWTRFRTGKIATTRTIDLHGRTASAAHTALHAFLRAAYGDGVRCVEVITGRGQGEGGVIRRELPHWLNAPELRALILAAAHPHAANPGSVRVLLRRVRG